MLNDLRQTHSLRGGKDGGSRKETGRVQQQKKKKKLGEANKLLNHRGIKRTEDKYDQEENWRETDGR